MKVWLSETERTVMEFEQKGLAEQAVLDVIAYACNKFFLMLEHNQQISDKQFKQQISRISNVSAVMFFILVQVPLSRFSSGFAFLTCFVVWFIDNQSKKWVYDICRALLTRDIRALK